MGARHLRARAGCRVLELVRSDVEGEPARPRALGARDDFALNLRCESLQRAMLAGGSPSETVPLLVIESLLQHLEQLGEEAGRQKDT